MSFPIRKIGMLKMPKIAMLSTNKEPRYKEVVVDFVDRVHGTGFPEIRPWRPLIAIPVEFVEVVTGTDSWSPDSLQG